MIIRDLRQFSSLFRQYTELRSQENRVLSIAYLQGNLVQNVRNATSGISARVYSGGSWGFASTPDQSKVREVIAEATSNAVFLDSREQMGLGSFTPETPVVEVNYGTTKQRLTQKEIMDFTKAVDDYIAKKYPNLSSRSVRLDCLDMEKTLLTSDGAYLYSLIPRSIFVISLSMDKNSDPVEVYDIAGGRGQFEDVFSKPEDLFPTIDELYEHLVKKSEGVYPEAGVKECVLDSQLAGILAHEAIGHTTEADMVIGGSVAGDFLNKQAASPLVSLADFAHSYNGEPCPIPIHVDDEGTAAEDVMLIEKGILTGYMHNKHSARHFNAKPTGNARAFTYRDEPLIRMRNTAILPGTSKLEDMIASIEDGYYLIQPSNGQADTTSEFMFGIVLGYEIKNGKLGRAIKDTTISGVAFDVLQNVTMVSDDMTWSCAGMCGKKQLIPVGMGGPAVKTKINIGGR
ncbi:MAG: TldD/PmbA family protein [Firmicutes bacterium]|nr:TldD/PmbA family protein [Bacillota bacterium]NLO66700.1 TldD/PmbA family protein [Bacillota bacterium]